MHTLLWLLFWLGGLIGLAALRVSLISATCAIGAALLITTFFSHAALLSLIVMWGIFLGLAWCLNHPDYKKRFIIHPAFDAMSKTLPHMSETEKVALEAGTVGWDGELFSGQPQWEKLLTIPQPKLSAQEQDFIDGPVKILCEMINEWEISHVLFDLPAKVWQFLKEQGFFALIIPNKYGGKGFSEFAHSEILAILAGRSVTLSSIVAVPNSLGPAELLLRYGTQEQRDHYLPRLAQGLEIPCFALTAPEAGSDAGSISDTGIVCKRMIAGKETIGILLNWNKRYITLAPVATLLGLAFKLYDPQFLLGDKTELGITCALIPTNTPGITIGRRHLPTNVPFQNGPTQGVDVFISIDSIIGGPSMAGHGWRMLVECLSTGRAISLPSSSAGCARVAALTSGAYSRIRRQFNISISAFEGIQEALARIAGFTYLSEAVRNLTVSMIDAGERPTVPGAISKYHVTELCRKIANDAMDIHGGKGIMMGPKNYLGHAYQSVPIAITVEGANILTRCLIIFGQGAIRCHPYLLKEMQALQHQNLQDFEHYFGQHLSFVLSNAAKSLFHGLTFAHFAPSPTHNETKPYFQALGRASCAFALVTDVSMGLLGGKLKFKEAISGRLGDLLAMQYMMSATLKRFQDQGSPEEDLPLVRWSVDYCLGQFWLTMQELLRNLPSPSIRFAVKLLVMPFGVPHHGPLDKLNRPLTEILTTDCAARTRLMGRTFISEIKADNIATIEQAFKAILEHNSLIQRVYDAAKHSQLGQGSLKHAITVALDTNIITEAEAQTLFEVELLYSAVIAVDDFAPDELRRPLATKDSVAMQH